MRGRRMPRRALPPQALQELPPHLLAQLSPAQQALLEAARRGVDTAAVALGSAARRRPARELEHAMQVALFDAMDAHPALRGLPIYAVPNFAGTYGSQRQRLRHGHRSKAAGRRAGVPDICVDVGTPHAHGLRLELKTDTGRLTEAQERWHAMLRQGGYAVVVVREAAVALELVLDYVAGGTVAVVESTRQAAELREAALRRQQRQRAATGRRAGREG